MRVLWTEEENKGIADHKIGDCIHEYKAGKTIASV